MYIYIYIHIHVYIYIYIYILHYNPYIYIRNNPLMSLRNCVEILDEFEVDPRSSK